MTTHFTPEQIRDLEAIIGYSFANKALLNRAFTHPSAVTDEAPFQHYERLEFLGDRVLGLAAAQTLFQNHPNADEGGLAKRLNYLVSRDACTQTAKELGFGEFVILGLSEQQSGGKRKAAILANVCEALIAAIYLDGGLEPAAAFFARNWGERLDTMDTAPKDAKTTLQEWAQSKGYAIPTYEITGQTGPDHRPKFSVSVTVHEFDPGIGRGKNKKVAEHAAAEDFLIREGIWQKPDETAND